MVQEIKISDDFTLQFEDMSGAEYMDITSSVEVLNRNDFETEQEYNKTSKLNDTNFIHSIANKIFKVNDVPWDIKTCKPYQISIIHDLVAGYVSDVKAKKLWDMKGWGKKQEEKELSESISEVSTKSKNKSKLK